MNATTELNATATLAAVLAKLDGLQGQLDTLVEHQRKTDELFQEMSPILKEVMATATEKLHGLEQKGYFAFGRELLRVGERIVESYKPDDVRQLGDAVVSILDTVRGMTQPEALAIASQASAVLANADQAQPIGIIGMVRASRSDEVQRGMAVMMELLRHVGRGAHALSRQKAGSDTKRARLDARLGRSRNLGVERPRLVARMVQPGAPAAVSCAAPARPGPVAVVMDGVAFSADGHLADPNAWTRPLAENLAAAQGVALSEAHWKLVELARADFTATKASPNIRRITQLAGVSTRDVYGLFPKAPARTLARIAGIPRPAGCL